MCFIEWGYSGGIVVAIFYDCYKYQGYQGHKEETVESKTISLLVKRIKALTF